MVNPKSEREVISDYFYDIREIWNDIDTLERQASQTLNFLGDINTKNKEYDGTWEIQPDAMVGLAHRILIKMSALAEKYYNEEIFEE
jgi:hypothetical protein